MSRARRRGLLRLGLLVASVIVLVVAISRLGGSGGSKTGSASAGRAAGGAPTARLRATISAERLPRPLHGETVAPTADGLLMIGGADRSDASTRQVLLLDSRTGRTSPAGTLIQPMHDSAAVTLSQRTMVFGGGASTTLDTVQELTPGAVARQIGRLPDPVSDLSAVEAGGAAYLVGGYDGQTPVASVLRTTDGRGFTKVGRLPTSVRYTTVAAIGDSAATTSMILSGSLSPIHINMNIWKFPRFMSEKNVPNSYTRIFKPIPTRSRSTRSPPDAR